MISGTRRMRWTPWTVRCWTGANCACKWRDTGARQIRITAAAEPHRGGTGDMDGEAEAVVLGAGGTVGLGPRAGAVPIADPATADPGPTPDQGPVPAPKPTHHAEASPNRLPGPVQGPSLSLTPGAQLPGPTKDPNHDPDREASPNLQWILEPLLNPEICQLVESSKIASNRCPSEDTQIIHISDRKVIVIWSKSFKRLDFFFLCCPQLLLYLTFEFHVIY